MLAWSLACDDSVEPKPPKQDNLAPETFLLATGDSLQPQLYRLRLSWLGSDADGRVERYRWRWLCEPGAVDCLVDSSLWSETAAVSGTFILPVPDGAARYIFEIAAVDDDGVADPTPARQLYELFNTPPQGNFVTGSVPTTSLPAITFFFTALDPDTTADERDGDSRTSLTHYEVWLDGSEANTRTVPIELGRTTLRLEDFDSRFGTRTLFLRVVDDGSAKSDTVQHTWLVESVPADGVLLVDDCRMGGFLEQASDRSYRNVVTPELGERLRVLDIEQQPFLLEEDISAQLGLFSRVIWYTDADTSSSGALELAQLALLELLEQRQGRVLLTSGLVFGTRGAFAAEEARFRAVFGIDTLYRAPDGSTNFSLNRRDSVEAAVHPGLKRFGYLTQGLRDIVECFGSRDAPDTRSLYFYPESTLVRGAFQNPVQFDVGVYHEAQDGARAIYVSIPIGLPINTNMGENEIEIREMLRLVEILDPQG